MNRLSPVERWRNRRVVAAAVAGLVGVLLLVALAVYLADGGARLVRHPSDEVAVTVRNVPPEVQFLAAVHDGPTGLEAMDWYVSTVSTFPVHPADCSASWHFNPELRDVERRIRWTADGRVGVAMMRDGPRWEVAWYGPDRARPADVSPVFGGGRWEADLSAPDRVEPLTEAQLRQLGFEGIGQNKP